MTEAEAYARDVLEGRQIAGELIKLSCQRFIDDLDRDDLVLDESAALEVIDFIEGHVHQWQSSWNGNKMTLQPWQKFIVFNLYGWKWKATGKRRIRTAYIQVARKNGKTSFAAALCLYHLYIEKEFAPEIFCGSNNEEQSKILTNAAGKMIRVSPSLQWYVDEREVNVFEYRGDCISIVHRGRQGKMKAMSRDARTKDGFSPSLAVVDEYHEAATDDMLNVIASGQGARPEPQLLVITTAGFRKDGPCYSKIRKMSVDVLRGISKDDSHFTAIYEPDPDDDWTAETTWKKANPNYGVSVELDYLPAEITKAINEGASREVNFRTKNLNTWVDAERVWIPDRVYMKNAHGFDERALQGAICYGGLDLAKGIDLNAFVLYFPHIDERQEFGVHPFKAWFWIPEDKVNTAEMDYRDWVRQGYVFVTPGEVIDHSYIVNFICEEVRKYDLQVLGFDTYLAYHGCVQSLIGAGVPCMPVSQGIATITTPAKELETMLTAGQMEHFNNPVMRWMVGNVTMHVDPKGNYQPHKGKSQGKIDGVAALLTAMAAATRQPVKTSVYATRGVISI